MSYLYLAFRFLIVYKEQKIYPVFSVYLDIGAHTASVTSKITENSLATDICQWQIFGIFVGDRRPFGSVVEHPLRDREVVGSNPGRPIPKAFKWFQWLPCLVLSIIRQALASLILTNIAQLTLQHLQT